MLTSSYFGPIGEEMAKELNTALKETTIDQAIEFLNPTAQYTLTITKEAGIPSDAPVLDAVMLLMRRGAEIMALMLTGALTQYIYDNPPEIALPGKIELDT